MIPAHAHGAASGGVSSELIALLPVLVAIAVYVSATIIGRQRGRAWPWFRTMFWIAGVLAGAAGFIGPLAAAAHESFVAHMAAHLLVGMAAPLLLVLSAPMTLALRTLSVDPARRLSRLLRSPLAGVLTHPIVAAALNVGGMWVLYRTPLYDLMQRDMLVHLLVMLHFLLAGYLYTYALVGIDPSPHRSGLVMRGVVLVSSLAAHGILAKLLYAHPPPGVPATEAHVGAQLMFTGGDAVDFVLIVLLCAEWYRATGRRLRATATSVSAAQRTEPAAPGGSRRTKGASA
ncbi:cytochrome c oxidase assembly protein [Leucobacter sp. NPDC077196]|uniref:cytochrome c oxidase assembly protein n=1 Tax=Leucobacter sp. NPDC077196 TaxID=3154959 RepID=UPI00343A8DF7